MSYVPPPVPERWDRGKWDQAHWDGQLGLAAATGSVVITASPVAFRIGRRLVATTTPIIVTTFAAGLRGARGLTANKGTVVVTSVSTTTLRYARKLIAAPAAITVAGYPAVLSKTGSYSLAAATSPITVTGGAAALRLARKLAATQSSIIVTGYPVDLIYTPSAGYTLDASPGSIWVSGSSAYFFIERAPPLMPLITPGSLNTRRAWVNPW